MTTRAKIWMGIICMVAAAILCIVVFADLPDTETISITIPSRHQEDFFYTDTEFTAVSNRITILSGQDLGDSMVLLKPIRFRQENTYEPTYITPGFPVEMEVEKGGVFLAGVLASNNSENDVIIELTISGIQLHNP